MLRFSQLFLAWSTSKAVYCPLPYPLFAFLSVQCHIYWTLRLCCALSQKFHVSLGQLDLSVVQNRPSKSSNRQNKAQGHHNWALSLGDLRIKNFHARSFFRLTNPNAISTPKAWVTCDSEPPGSLLYKTCLWCTCRLMWHELGLGCGRRTVRCHFTVLIITP